MTTDGTVGVADSAASTAKKVDTSELTVGANTVERQRVVIADSSLSSGLLGVDASGRISVNINGTVPVSGTVAVTGTFWPVTQPVSGTFWQTTQPVSGTFWQATQPVSGTFWQATQPVSAAALPLPTGAATLAKQPALGTAGSAATDVLTVQGIAAMTALKVDGSAVTQPVSGTIAVSGSVTVAQSTASNLKVDLSGTAANATAIKTDGSAVTQPVSGTVTANIGSSGSLALDASVTGLQVAQGSTTSGQKGALALGAVTTAAPSYTTAQSSPLSLTAGGSLRIDLGSIGASALAAAVASVDAAANSGANVTVPVKSFGSVFNGTTWDRMAGSTAGVFNVIRDAAGNARGANVNASNQLSVSVDNSNVSANIAQMNGVAVTMGNGVSGTGVQRVTLASDGTGQVVLAAGSATIGALTANQSVNAAQVSGTAISVGNGVSGTGVQRVTVASDSTGTLAVTQATASSLNTQAVGNAASGAADSGNPVKVAGKYNLTPPTFTDGNRADLQLDNRGNLAITINGYGTIANAGVSIQTSDGISSSVYGLQTNSSDYTFNGTSWDRTRNNVDTAALVTLSAAGAGTTTSSDQTNYNGSGAIVVVDITAATAMTLTVKVQGKDAASGKYYDILTSAAFAATGTNVLTVYPGATVAANVTVSFPLPRTWRVSATVTGTSVTAKIGASVNL